MKIVPRALVQTEKNFKLVLFFVMEVLQLLFADKYIQQLWTLT